MHGTGNPVSPSINNIHVYFTVNTSDSPVNAGSAWRPQNRLEQQLNKATKPLVPATRARYPRPFPSLPPTLCPVLSSSAGPCQDRELAQKLCKTKSRARGAFLRAASPAPGAPRALSRLNYTFGGCLWTTPRDSWCHQRPCAPRHPLLPSAPRPPPAPPRCPHAGALLAGGITWLLPPPLGPEQREVPVGPEPAQQLHQQRQESPSRQRQAQRAPPRHGRRSAPASRRPFIGAAPAAHSQRRPPPRLPAFLPSLPPPCPPSLPSPLGRRSPPGPAVPKAAAISAGAAGQSPACRRGWRSLSGSGALCFPSSPCPQGSRGCPAFPRCKERCPPHVPGSGIASRAWLRCAETKHCWENKSQCPISWGTSWLSLRDTSDSSPLWSSPRIANPAAATPSPWDKSHPFPARFLQECCPWARLLLPHLWMRTQLSHLPTLANVSHLGLQTLGWWISPSTKNTRDYSISGHHFTHLQFLMTDLLVLMCRGEKLCSCCFDVPKYFTRGGIDAKKSLDRDFSQGHTVIGQAGMALS